MAADQLGDNRPQLPKPERPFFDPTCPYPDIVYPGDLCIRKCWLKLCPRGIGPFDQGPHNFFDPRAPRR